MALLQLVEHGAHLLVRQQVGDVEVAVDAVEERLRLGVGGAVEGAAQEEAEVLDRVRHLVRVEQVLAPPLRWAGPPTFGMFRDEEAGDARPRGIGQIRAVPAAPIRFRVT